MATGDTLNAAFAHAHTPVITNGARLLRRASSSLHVLHFDDGTDQFAYFQFHMPGQYDGTTGLTVGLRWLFETFGSGNTCGWEAAFARLDDDVHNISSLTFATEQAFTLATEASATGELDYITKNFTNAEADGIQPNEDYVLRINRDAALGTPAPGDAQLFAVDVRLQ